MKNRHDRKYLLLLPDILFDALVVLIAGIFSTELFLHSLFPLYSFFNLTTWHPSLPCTAFFYDVFDNLLSNESIVKVTGARFFSKARYKSFNARILSSVKNKLNLIWVSKRFSQSKFHE